LSTDLILALSGNSVSERDTLAQALIALSSTKRASLNLNSNSNLKAYYGRWISIVPEIGGFINSVQNGLLLCSNIHQLFGFYDFSINPDVCVSYTFYMEVQ
jgi:hypothetical protein